MSGPGAKPQAAGERDHRWLLVDDLPCLGCGYNLRGLAGPVVTCPECGHANDLRDPSPWRLAQLPVGVINRQHWPASAVAISFVVFLGTVWTAGGLFNDSLPGFLIAGLFLAVAIFFWGREALKWMRSCRSVTWAVTVLVLLHVRGIHLTQVSTTACGRAV